MSRKILFLLCCGFFIPALWSSCDNNGMEIGTNWVDTHTRTVLIDTCTVRISSVLLDSIPTSGGSLIFAGTYRAPLWGKTETSTYLTFAKTTDYSHRDDPIYNSRLRFDSLTLVLRPDSMFIGDTLKMYTLQAHRLQKQIELNDDGELYGHSAFPYNPVPLGTKTFHPRPYRGREVELRLPDELGQEFLTLLIKQEKEMDSNENFKRYFNGLVLTGASDNEAILGFKAADSLTYLKLYYHSRSGDTVNHQLLFKQETSTMFTHVDSDRTGAPLDGISFKNNDIPSSRTDNMSFVEGLTGIYTKIEFPHLNRIRELGDHGAVVSATLLVYPLRNSYGRQNYSELPKSMLMYVSNELNVTTGSITDNNDQLQTGSLNLDIVNPENTYYSYDVTDFIKGQLGTIGINKRNLQMIGNDYGYTLRSMVLGNQDVGDKNIQLQILYSIYNE